MMERKSAVIDKKTGFSLGTILSNHSMTLDYFLEFFGYSVDYDGQIIDSDGNLVDAWFDDLDFFDVE